LVDVFAPTGRRTVNTEPQHGFDPERMDRRFCTAAARARLDWGSHRRDRVSLIDGNYSRNLASKEAYDPATNSWEQRAPMPTARSGIAAAVLEGRVFVFGGEAPAGTFNQAARRIYVISGGPTPGDSVSTANEIFVPWCRNSVRWTEHPLPVC
jgi:hypothetical protein